MSDDKGSDDVTSKAEIRYKSSAVLPQNLVRRQHVRFSRRLAENHKATRGRKRRRTRNSRNSATPLYKYC